MSGHVNWQALLTVFLVVLRGTLLICVEDMDRRVIAVWPGLVKMKTFLPHRRVSMKIGSSRYEALICVGDLDRRVIAVWPGRVKTETFLPHRRVSVKIGSNRVEAVVWKRRLAIVRLGKGRLVPQ